jgi:glutamate--cysteine ligase
MGIDSYLAYFDVDGEPEGSLSLGIEYELLGVFEESAEAISFDGPRSLSEVFRNLIRTGRYAPVKEKGNTLGLQGPGYRVTLEPGCQVEYSSGVHASLVSIEREFQDFRENLLAASAPLRIRWLPLGIQPVTPLAKMGLIPKERYRIMTKYFPVRGGRLALVMMRQTGGFQVGVGYRSLEDAAQKFVVAMRASSFVSAAFANSSIAEGRPNGHQSYRMMAWSECDPDRCLYVEKGLNREFTPQDYVDYAMDAPMVFLARGERYIPFEGKVTFRRFSQEGYLGYREEPSDWEVQLSMVFPEVRLRPGYVEVRAMDGAPPELAMAGAAFWRGLLEHADVRERALSIVGETSLEERLELHRRIAREGLSAEYRGRRVLDAARELSTAAREGLAHVAPNEVAYLAPLERVLAEGRPPAMRFLPGPDARQETRTVHPGRFVNRVALR